MTTSSRWGSWISYSESREHGTNGKNETQLTDTNGVNWGPYWHPDGQHLIYATSAHGHQNYELYLMRSDGSRKTLDEKWTYWEGPGFKSALPIKWKIVEDPVDEGMVLQSDDPAAKGGKYGTADIITKKEFDGAQLNARYGETFQGDGADYAFDAVGRAALVQAGIVATRRGGTISDGDTSAIGPADGSPAQIPR